MARVAGSLLCFVIGMSKAILLNTASKISTDRSVEFVPRTLSCATSMMMLQLLRSVW